MSDTKDWNPRYLAYCRSWQKTPEEMLEFDKGRFPGGCMAGFIVWTNEQWLAFERETEKRPVSSTDRSLRRLLNEAAFDTWLNR